MDKPAHCGGDHCGACCGGSCSGGGCRPAVTLTPLEYELLLAFGRTPFLPAAFPQDREKAVCFDLPGEEGAVSAALAGLRFKHLIDIDWDIPLTGFDYTPYAAYPYHGSMALTAQGQRVLDLLDINGISE